MESPLISLPLFCAQSTLATQQLCLGSIFAYRWLWDRSRTHQNECHLFCLVLSQMCTFQSLGWSSSMLVSNLHWWLDELDYLALPTSHVILGATMTPLSQPSYKLEKRSLKSKHASPLVCDHLCFPSCLNLLSCYFLMDGWISDVQDFIYMYI